VAAATNRRAPTGAEPESAGGLTNGEFSAAVHAITNAFGDTTRREIYLLARERPDGLTASMVAEQFSLHANVARHHLDKLAAGGYLDVVIERTDGAGAGRPAKRYRHSGQNEPLEVPVKTDDLVLTLLGRALEMLPDSEAERMAEEVGIEYGRAMASAMNADGAQRSFRNALHAVADALSAHGFAAHTERRGNQLRIISNHCPFGEMVVEHPVICAVDRGMVRGMLATLYGDSSPETAASRPQGDQVCVTSFA
jgi:predicted ArsR family transcriptional regulator